MASRISVILLALLLGLSMGQSCQEPVHPHLILAGDSYNVLQVPYFEHHSRCPLTSFSQGARQAAQVLNEDLPLIAALVASLPADRRPVVVVSAGAVDHAGHGPVQAAAIVQAMGEAILALRDDLVLLHIDYGLSAEPLETFQLVDFSVSDRWHFVLTHDIVNNAVGPDGLHLPPPGYVERFIVAARQHPSHLVCPPVLDTF